MRKKSNIRYKKLEINFTKWVKCFFAECIRREKILGGWYYRQKNRLDDILVKGPKMVHKRFLNQTKIVIQIKRPVDVKPMEVLFGTFDLPIT